MKPTVDQELLSLLKLSIDHNSTIMTIATQEIAGDWSSHNRTHQRKVFDLIQEKNAEYNARLGEAYKRVNEAFTGTFTKLQRSQPELDEIFQSMMDNGVSKEDAAQHMTEHYELKEKEDA